MRLSEAIKYYYNKFTEHAREIMASEDYIQLPVEFHDTFCLASNTNALTRSCPNLISLLAVPRYQ